MTDLYLGLRLLLTFALVVTGAVWIAAGVYLILHWSKARLWWPIAVAVPILALLLFAILNTLGRLW